MKKPTNATKAKATAPKVGAAPAKAPAATAAAPATASTASTADTVAEPAGDVVVDPAEIVTVSEEFAGTDQEEQHNAPEAGEVAEAGQDHPTAADIQAAYDQGYSTGFSDALDAGPTLETLASAASTSDQSAASDDRARLVALAMYTPETQRKGGITPVVNRMQAFLDSLPPGDRWPALQLMTVIGQTKPIDLASGRFEHSVREGLGALNGDGDAIRANDSSVSSAAAAARFAEMFPEDPDDRPGEGQGGEDPDLDLTDAHDANAAAARLAGL